MHRLTVECYGPAVITVIFSLRRPVSCDCGGIGRGPKTSETWPIALQIIPLSVASGVVCGFGLQSYTMGLRAAVDLIAR